MYFFKKCMTRAFSVVHAFNATNAISGRQREFKPGETLLCDPGQADGTVTIEIQKSLFLVERSIFETCCKWKNDGAAPFFLRLDRRVALIALFPARVPRRTFVLEILGRCGSLPLRDRLGVPLTVLLLVIFVGVG